MMLARNQKTLIDLARLMAPFGVAQEKFIL